MMAGLVLAGWMATAGAQNSSSDWMELVKGYKDKGTGAELRDIQYDANKDAQRVTIAIPKTALNGPQAMEEVRVVGRRPEKPEPWFEYRYEWVDDYDNNYYGLVFYVGKDQQVPFRIFLDSSEGFLH
jgi:hypothetical protein